MLYHTIDVDVFNEKYETMQMFILSFYLFVAN